MRKSFIVLCTLLLTAGPLWAEVTRLDPVVVTATRTATALSQIASSVTVITAEEIEAKQQAQVIDVLRSVPGVTLTQSGPLGGQTSIYLRGGDNKHTLILIDGIEFRDASAIGGDANLANLSTDNIEQIEIVRGAQSVLYGSDAIGGVINIITKKGSKKPSGYAFTELGSYSTQREDIGFSLGNEIFLTSLAATRTKSDGFSAANEENNNTEDDSYDNTSLSLNLGVKPVKNFELNLNLRHADTENEFDNSFSGVVSDAENLDNNIEKTGKITGKLNLLEDRWQVELGAAASNIERDTRLGTYRYGYDGKITKFNLLNNIQIGKFQTLIVGLETEKEEYDGYADGEASTHEEATTKAVFIQDQFSAGSVSVSIGIRLDDHETFGEKTTWRFAPSYSFATIGTRLKGSIGTGFKAPSLYQLYHPYFGNSDLEAEESLSYDIGIEQSLLNHSLILDITYFHNDIKDYIDFDDIGWTGYFQGGDIATKGVETTLIFYPSEMVNFQLGYTYTDSEKDGSRKDLIPLHKGTFDFNFYPVEKLQLNLNTTYTSARDDGATDETLPSYTLVNLATSYQVNDNFKVFGRIDNLFDKDYEEVAGYGTAGLSGYAGIKLSF